MLPEPGTDIIITDDNRRAVQTWLIEQGMDETRVMSMRDATLTRAYSKPQYLRALLTRIDYAPAVKREPIPSPAGNGPQSRDETPFRKQLEDSLRGEAAELAAIIQRLVESVVKDTLRRMLDRGLK